MFIDLRVIGRKREGRQREKHQCEREALTSCLPYCAVTGNRTRNLLVYGMTLQPNEPLGQGPVIHFLYVIAITT